MTDGAKLGASLAVALQRAIVEARKKKYSKPLCTDLELTMKRWLPVTEDFCSLQKYKEGENLKELSDIIIKARLVVHNFSGVLWYEKPSRDQRNHYQLELLKLTNQLKQFSGNPDLVDGLSKPDIEPVGLDLGLTEELRNRLLDSRDFVLTMKRWLLEIQDLCSCLLQKNRVGEGLKELSDFIKKAQLVVHNFSGVPWYKKSIYARKVERISRDKLNYYQIELFMLTNQLKQFSGNLDLVDGLIKSISPPKPDIEPVGFDLALTELRNRLLDDDVVPLVVSAPPGCGKTTLVTQLCHDADIKGKFKRIFFFVVSNTPNLKVMVQTLIMSNRYDAPTFENDSEAVVSFRTLLRTLRDDGPILLVLDDVWPGAESFLQNFRMNLPGYKILVSSRSNLPGFGSTYHLKPLDDDYARDLLKQRALQPNDASQDEYEDLLQKILKRCSGFPLLIEVIGGSLNGQSLLSWKRQVESWSEGGTVLDKYPLECLQPSFNILDSNLKECFMDMGLFLEDQKIRASTIIDIWLELYGEGSRGSSTLWMDYLKVLATQNLLKLVLPGNENKDGFYNDCLVAQHDILRELAICQTKSEANLEKKRLNLEIKDDKFPDWCLNLRQPINARLLSISTDDSFSSKWVDLVCPNVEALVLHVSSSNYALPSFIARMTKLKVLTIMNHGFYPVSLSNFSCLSSLPNLKRIRLEKVLLTLLDIPQLRLCSLEKLSLVMCTFGEIFYDVDVSVALPSLQEIDMDHCYDLDELPYWISEVISLKTLSVTNSNKLDSLPEAIGNLSNLEVLRLSSCNHLTELSEATERLIDLRFLDISDCKELRKLPLEIGKLQKLKKISMRECRRCYLPDSVKNLKDLEVKINEECAYMWNRLEPVMKNLRVESE